MFYNNPNNRCPKFFKYLKIIGKVCYMAKYEREEKELPDMLMNELHSIPSSTVSSYFRPRKSEGWR